MANYPHHHDHSSAIAARYRCCCGCCRATTGAVLVGIMDVLVAAVCLWQGLTGKLVLFASTHSEYEQPLRQSCLVGAGVFGLIGFLAVFAAICRLPCLLIFHMVVDIAVLLAFGLLSALIVIITFVASVNDENSTEGSAGSPHDTTRIIVFLCIIGVMAVLQIWYFLIMLSAYRSLSEEDASIRSANAAATVDHRNHATTYSVVGQNGQSIEQQQQQQPSYCFTPAANDQQQQQYYAHHQAAAARSNGVPLSPGGGYTPMLGTPNYYKQSPQPPFTSATTSPPMYG